MRPHRIPRPCEFCGQPIKSQNLSVRYCSHPCYVTSHHGTTAERLWANVDKLSSPYGCWLWIGSTYPNGRPKFEGDKKKGGAARFVWVEIKGPLPDELDLLHQCSQRGAPSDDPLCVNPAHQEPGDDARNKREAVERGQAPIGDRHYLRRDPSRTSEAFRHSVHPRGEQNHKAILNDTQVAELRRRFDAGENRHRLAEEFRASLGTIYNIGTRRTRAIG